MKPIVVKESAEKPKPLRKKAPVKQFEPKPCHLAPQILYCRVTSCVEAGACTYQPR